MRRDLPIITTPHAKSHLAHKDASESFTDVHDLDFFDSMFVDIGASESKAPSIKVTGMPGKHVPPGILGTANDILKAVPPTNGWMVELGYGRGEGFECGYRYVFALNVDLSCALKDQRRENGFERKMGRGLC